MLIIITDNNDNDIHDNDNSNDNNNNSISSSSDNENGFGYLQVLLISKVRKNDSTGYARGSFTHELVLQRLGPHLNIKMAFPGMVISYHPYTGKTSLY